MLPIRKYFVGNCFLFTQATRFVVQTVSRSCKISELMNFIMDSGGQRNRKSAQTRGTGSPTFAGDLILRWLTRRVESIFGWVSRIFRPDYNKQRKNDDVKKWRLGWLVASSTNSWYDRACHWFRNHVRPQLLCVIPICSLVEKKHVFQFLGIGSVLQVLGGGLFFLLVTNESRIDEVRAFYGPIEFRWTPNYVIHQWWWRSMSCLVLPPTRPLPDKKSF